MHILITAVSKGVVHWLDFFDLLTERLDITVTLLAAELEPQTEEGLRQLVGRRSNFGFIRMPLLLDQRHSGHMASVLLQPSSMRALQHRPAPDVIHIIGQAGYLSTWQLVRLRNQAWPDVPITIYAAQNIPFTLPFPFPMLERHAYRATDHAFPITPSALNVLRTRGYTGPATIVPLGVDTKKFRPCESHREHPDRFTVGFVGRLEQQKGIADLLTACEILDCDLLIVGNGTLRSDVERASARRRGRIHHMPWADHTTLPALMSRMSVLALPSVEIVQRNVLPWIGIPLREQFGRVLIEAMACGVPVVGSDTGDIPYVIGSAGLVHPAGDAEGLAKHFAQVRDDPELARRLATDGRLRAVTEFDWRGIADKLCCTWRQLSAGRPSPNPKVRTEKGEPR